MLLRWFPVACRRQWPERVRPTVLERLREGALLHWTYYIKLGESPMRRLL